MSTYSSPILVVDDEWAIRQQLSRALASVGIECECAFDGDDALDRFIHGHHPLVVTDLRMPERHGHSLAIKLLEQPDPPKVVALTGVTDPRLATDLRARGVTEVVYKPVNYFDLAERIKGMLDPAGFIESESTTEGLLEDAPRVEEVDKPPTSRALQFRERLEQVFMQSPLPHRWLVMTLLWLNWKLLPNPPKELRETLRQFSATASKAEENRRFEGRVTLNRRAVALQLTEDFEPQGFPFKVALRDLSQHGVGLLHTEPLNEQLIALSWQGTENDRVVIVARVLRCRQVGQFYDIGASVVQFRPPTG